MDVSTYAKSFIQQYSINDLDYEKLSEIIQKLGYTLIEYNLLFNNELVDDIIQSLNLQNVLKDKQCFTYYNEVVKYIFLRDNLSESDKITLLLHEIGHIYLEHVTSSVIINETKFEREANEFAVLVLQLIDKHKSKKKQLTILLDVTIALCIIALTIAVILFMIDFTSESHDKSIDSSQPDTSYIKDVSSVIETTTPATTTTITTTTTQETKPTAQDQQDQSDIFYITTSGNKYHNEWCPIIQNKTNVYYGTKEDLENMGYEPCSLCCGG